MGSINKLDYSGQDIFVGLDTHLKNWRVSIMVGEDVFKTFSQDSCSELLSKYLARNFPNANYYSAYEASFCGFKIHRDLLNLGNYSATFILNYYGHAKRSFRGYCVHAI